MSTGHPNELILLPSLKAYRNGNGALVLTQKYLEGAAEYAKTWPGPVTSLVRINTDPSTDMDLVEVGPDTSETPVEVRPEDEDALAARLGTAAAALAHLSPFEADVGALCHSIGVPILFTSEYSPCTERQIVDASERNPLKRWRRKVWLKGAERTRQNILRRHAAGLQCSGTPTHDLYRPLSPEALLFFDNRVRREGVISEADLATRTDGISDRKPLRLVFGGRLIAMKGVLELPKVAQALDRLGVPYRMDIYGDGELDNELRKQISAGDLSERIAVHPSMDFRTGWIPLLMREADLFVCCHLQGDPASTYPEVMSCGVPIVGYDNEAFAGIVRESGASWSSPMNDPAALAAVIARVDGERNEIIDAARRGREFALAHTFEATFARRISHIVNASKLSDEIKRDRAADQLCRR